MSEENMNGPSGIFVVNKEQGWTSFDVVAKARGLFGTRKIGHTGTLDPMATGVLVLLIGNATRIEKYLASDRKKYTAILKLGQKTDTEDTTGKILYEHNGPLPSFEDVKKTAGSFAGDILQTPPMYSAIKIGGKKLVDLARKNIEIDREKRTVHIYGIETEETGVPDEYRLYVECGGGTYIRTLCSDIGNALSCCGVMAGLERTMCCGFDLSSAVTISEAERMTAEERLERIRPIDDAFAGEKRLYLDGFFEKLAKSGQQIFLDKVSFEAAEGEKVLLCDKKGIFSVAVVKNYEGKAAAKPEVVLRSTYDGQ